MRRKLLSDSIKWLFGNPPLHWFTHHRVYHQKSVDCIRLDAGHRGFALGTPPFGSLLESELILMLHF